MADWYPPLNWDRTALDDTVEFPAVPAVVGRPTLLRDAVAPAVPDSPAEVRAPKPPRPKPKTRTRKQGAVKPAKKPEPVFPMVLIAGALVAIALVVALKWGDLFFVALWACVALVARNRDRG